MSPLGLDQRIGRQLMLGDLPVGLAGSEVLGRGRSGRQGEEVSPAGAQGQGRHHFGLTRGFEDVLPARPVCLVSRPARSWASSTLAEQRSWGECAVSPVLPLRW